MAGNFKMNDDYIEVAERIALFKSAYPDGTLQPLDHLNPYVVQEVGGETLIVYAAAAYRTPDDPRPGVGVASEVFPGRTPYTKGSEVANAETSAWGRAIVALGIPSKHVATKEDVRNRQAEQGDAGKGSGADEQRERAATAEPAPSGNNGGITRTQAEQLHAAIFSKGRTDAAVLTILGEHGIGDGVRFGSIPADKFAHVLAQLSKLADPPPPEPSAPAAAPAPAESVSAEDFAGPPVAAQEPAEEVAAPAAASATPEPVAAAQAAPAAQGGAEDDIDFDVLDEAIKAQAEKTAQPEKAKRKATVTDQQKTRLGALCASIEAKGVGEMEWRTYMETEEGVRSRTQLTKAAATRMIDRLNRWSVDLQTGVVGAKKGAAA